MKEALDTSYGPLLEEQMGKRNARSLRYYEEMDPVLQELGEREQQLVLEYDQASSAEYQVKADGEDWTYERLAQDLEPYSGRYYEIQNALDRERNKTVGEIYRHWFRCAGRSPRSAVITIMRIMLISPCTAGILQRRTWSGSVGGEGDHCAS